MTVFNRITFAHNYTTNLSRISVLDDYFVINVKKEFKPNNIEDLFTAR